ncbi:hypothetical protein OAB63_04580 [Alphaproteobacteria bacterium]|nr:hypothetical protein [Alphaproteobacteria bacterium]
MVIIILKFFHFLALFSAGGIGVGGAIVQSVYIKEGKVPEPHLGRAFRILGFIGLISIVTLWITGVILAQLLYGGFSINIAFTIKIIGAATILIVSCISNFHVFSSFKNQSPPNTKLMKKMMVIGRSGLVLALGGAAVAFI